MARKRKPGSGNKKGSTFERKICKRLSLWWTSGKHDDIFWRSDTSGGRATSRKGKRTYGQHGDICAKHPSGRALIELCAIECKHGYVKDSIADLIDRQDRHRPQFLKFVEQAIRQRKEAGVPYWLLITQRTGREILVLFPHRLMEKLPFVTDKDNYLFTMADLSPNFRMGIKLPESKEPYWIVGTTLNEFIRWVNPQAFAILHRKWKRHLARKQKK
jgi:hypothetical protein